MAHLEGFEPPTNRFVAEYSIQLSYRCIKNKLFVQDGAPGGIRTPDQSVRSRVLYPAELQVHSEQSTFWRKIIYDFFLRSSIFCNKTFIR